MYTGDNFGLFFRYSRLCNVPVPPEECADLGGALRASAWPEGGESFVAIVMFVPSGFASVSRESLAGALQAYEIMVRASLAACVHSPLDAHSRLQRHVDCIDGAIMRYP